MVRHHRGPGWLALVTVLQATIGSSSASEPISAPTPAATGTVTPTATTPGATTNIDPTVNATTNPTATLAAETNPTATLTAETCEVGCIHGEGPCIADAVAFCTAFA